MYKCSTCGAAVVVETSGQIKRSCEHTSTVITELDCVLYGEGGTAEPQQQTMTDFFHEFGIKVMEKIQNG